MITINLNGFVLTRQSRVDENYIHTFVKQKYGLSPYFFEGIEQIDRVDVCEDTNTLTAFNVKNQIIRVVERSPYTIQKLHGFNSQGLQQHFKSIFKIKDVRIVSIEELENKLDLKALMKEVKQKGYYGVEVSPGIILKAKHYGLQ